jgi:dCTP deaminase
MFLTGPKIEEEIAAKRIVIDPYDPALVGPNSVDIHLHREVKYYTKMQGVLDMKKPNRTASFTIGDDGYILNPGCVYLCCTVEWIETDHYVIAVGGRSSIARLGITLHQTAPFGHMGFKGRLTLEVAVIEPVRVYVDKPMGQIFFQRTEGEPRLYNGPYQNQQTALTPHFWK